MLAPPFFVPNSLCSSFQHGHTKWSLGGVTSGDCVALEGDTTMLAPCSAPPILVRQRQFCFPRIRTKTQQCCRRSHRLCSIGWWEQGGQHSQTSVGGETRNCVTSVVGNFPSLPGCPLVLAFSSCFHWPLATKGPL